MSKTNNWNYYDVSTNTYECPNCHSVLQLEGSPEDNDLNYCYTCGAHLILDDEKDKQEPIQRFELIRLLRSAYCELEDLRGYFESCASSLCGLTRKLEYVLDKEVENANS